MPIEFVYTDQSALNSSWLNRAYYNSVTRELAVVTRGLDSYIYEDVDWATFEDLIKVISPGSYYNTRIRGSFDNKYGAAVLAIFKTEEKKTVAIEAKTKTFTVRAFVPFEAQIEASSLDEAVKIFNESHTDVPGVTIKEVVVPFAE